MSTTTTTASSVPSQVTLTSILPSPYLLVYAIPLLFISLLLTFAGSFLTLDRTRSFPPSPDALNELTKHKKPIYRLEAGVGGLAGGWVFGMHLTTYLSLLIMNDTSSSPLGAVDFLLVWLPSSILLSVLTGRWKIVSLLVFAITGGAAFAILLSVVFHPALTARLIFLAIAIVLLLIGTFVPFPHVQRGATRMACSLVGSFGTIVSISLLGNTTSWQNAWMRLVVKNMDDWGGGKEKGLSAAMCVLCLVGAGCDFVLKRKFGENPDEKWDSYLASYASNLPSDPRRAGTFQPLLSAWNKIFTHTAERPILFPSDAELKSGPRPPPQIPRRKRHHHNALVKFRPFDKPSDSDSDSDGDDAEKTLAHRSPNTQRKLTSMSDATLLNSENGDRDKENVKDTDDILNSSPPSPSLRLNRSTPHSAHWKPGFFRHHEEEQTRMLEPDLEQGLQAPAPLGTVPATPSLIRAINRVTEAQNAALAPLSPPPRLPDHIGGKSVENSDEGKREWNEFWSEVKAKAGHLTNL